MLDLVKIPEQSDLSGKPLPSVLPVQERIIDSKSLFSQFAQGDVVLIQHRGECYVLRRTRSGKLILTK